MTTRKAVPYRYDNETLAVPSYFRNTYLTVNMPKAKCTTIDENDT